VSKRLPSPEEATEILRETGCSPRVIRHCKAVAELAVRIAERCAKNGIVVDVQLVHIGALLHDIGRSKTHSVHHVAAGAEIARTLDLPASVTSIIERHVGGGVTANEASELGWPNKSHMPETLEEKIVTYADKLIDNAKIVPIEKTIQKLEKKLGSDHPAVRRVLDLHREISDLSQERNS
jgi:uncharacterized protein